MPRPALAKSDADFISKNEDALQELEECLYWIELLVDSGIVNWDKMRVLTIEVEELIPIFVTLVKRVKGKKQP